MSSFINFKNFNDASNLPLTRQSSIYSLTFDELQTTLGGSGKDFGSMNMDELLKNIWTAEETQAMASTSFGIDGTMNNNNNNNNTTTNNTSMQRQGSLTLPRTLSQKTVDEVWRELLLKTSNNNGVKDGILIEESNLQAQEREPTLGEMTLEDFLLKAGIVTENNTNGAYFGGLSQQNVENSNFGFGFQNSNQNHGFNHGQMVNQITEAKPGLDMQPKPVTQVQPQLQPLFPKQAALNFGAPLKGQVASPGARVGKTENFVKTSVVQASGTENKKLGSPRNLIPKSNVDTSPSPPFYGFGEGGVCGRRSGTLEKVVERRRRRMIKNRESAARSRARKQAYTLELEAEVAKLKELNHELLKKQEEIMEMQNNQVVEKMKLPWGSKRLCLRRTLTGPW